MLRELAKSGWPRSTTAAHFTPTVNDFRSPTKNTPLVRSNMSHISQPPVRSAARRSTPPEPAATDTSSVQIPAGQIGEAMVTVTITADGKLSPKETKNALERAVRFVGKASHLDLQAFLALLEAASEEARLDQAALAAKTRVKMLLSGTPRPTEALEVSQLPTTPQENSHG
jgi:hypothetical protein